MSAPVLDQSFPSPRQASPVCHTIWTNAPSSRDCTDGIMAMTMSLLKKRGNPAMAVASLT